MSSLICACGKEKISTQKKICEDCRKEKKKIRSRLNQQKYRDKHGSKVKRGIYCSRCKGIKEHQERGYCLACERERYLEKSKPDCATCGKPKENVRDAYCHDCKNERTRLKSIAENRRPKTKGGRRTTCSNCGTEKEKSYLNEAYCRTCTSEKNKKKNARNRELLGKPPFVPGKRGKKLTCCCCGAIKEKQEHGYCNACRRKKDNEHRLATGITKKHNTGLCPCGNERASYSQAYCKECLAERGKERPLRYPETEEQRIRRNERNRARYYEKRAGIPARVIVTLTPEERLIRNHARNLCRKRIASGVLIKQPCEVCNTNVNIEAHHDDYSKPLEVRWLCRKHHCEHHRNET